MMIRPDERPTLDGMDEQIEEELLVFSAAEMLSRAMEGRGLNKKELSERLGKSKPFVTQLLNGGRNLTLRTLARVAYSLGYRLRLTLEPITMRRMRLNTSNNDQHQPPRVFSWITKCDFQPPLEHSGSARRVAGESGDQSLAA